MSRTVDTEIEKFSDATSLPAKEGEVKDDKMNHILDSNKHIEKRLGVLEQSVKAIADNLPVKAEDPDANKEQSVDCRDVIETLKGWKFESR